MFNKLRKFIVIGTGIVAINKSKQFFRVEKFQRQWSQFPMVEKF